ncbi:hypothetical protein OG989_05570 [Micromonospora sp. NBC_01740]|uniref:hypothetical protein n=1 Tax=Micromonospora sp. NBC_01740 TaxID=2975986 RepID=UPI002E1420FD|nr:hypothetical protein OG989_05570 [Micromonospora sp. NBC_01740]
MGVKKLLAAGLTTASAVVSAAIGTSSPAIASDVGPAGTAYGCGYPQVCFYKTQANWTARDWTAAYQDITGSYQNLSSGAYGSYYVYNSRNDDGALLHYTNGYTYCLHPSTYVNNSTNPTGFWTVDKIRIMDSPTC